MSMIMKFGNNLTKVTTLEKKTFSQLVTKRRDKNYLVTVLSLDTKVNEDFLKTVFNVAMIHAGEIEKKIISRFR